MTRIRSLLPALLCAATLLACSVAETSATPEDASAEAPTDPVELELEPHAGLLPVYLDASTGRVWLELPPADARGVHCELIWAVGLRAGVGHHELGLDRGEYGRSQLVRFRRLGAGVGLELVNTQMRATSEDPDEHRAVRDSFVSSVVWAGAIAGREDDGRVRVEISSLLTGDHASVARRLQATDQGTPALAPERSAVAIADSLVFPTNLEFDATLSFDLAEPGHALADLAPDPSRISVVAHHSFVKLPEPGFAARVSDPRVGLIEIEVRDYAAPLAESVPRELALRHRLEPGEPLVYYVDRGAPEPIRSALIEGASWWSTAFEEAGHAAGFRVELLPEDAHPMDVRYNVITWVHRVERGWSFGGSVIDPRTGEIIKGNVTLGSQRVRQDRRIFEGLLGAARTGSGAPDDPIELALARIRQLAAHEVGHTLGLDHNFAASSCGRASVMDYPAPLITLKDGQLDASEAYGVGVGAWDRHVIAWLYAELDDAGRDALVADAATRGLLYLSDPDSRPPSAADPRSSLWDNGEDPVAELLRMLELRSFALARLGADRLAPARPLDELELVFATVYFGARYQLQAAAKVVGGRTFQHTRAGDRPTPVEVVPAARQRAALAATLELLRPEALDIPEATLALLQPGPYSRERLRGDDPALFDALGAAGTAAEEVYAALLEPARMLRLVDQARRDPEQLGLEQVLAALSEAVVAIPRQARLAEIARVVRRRYVEHLVRLRSSTELRGELRSRIDAQLRALLVELRPSGDAVERNDRAALVAAIEASLAAPAPTLELPPSAAPMPPGSPIGAGPWACEIEDWGLDLPAWRP